MKELRPKFNELTQKYPDLSTFSIFVKLIKANTVPNINRYFYRLVEKDDYKGTSEVRLLRWLNSIKKGSV
jgi:cephalosporin-C deacetylase-like acetyl esterase